MHDDIGEALKLIFEGIKLLQGCCTDGRQFTIDGDSLVTSGNW